MKRLDIQLSVDFIILSWFRVHSSFLLLVYSLYIVVLLVVCNVILLELQHL